jgi:peptidoglycan/LPS O-acetylase OafA/YrhL
MSSPAITPGKDRSSTVAQRGDGRTTTQATELRPSDSVSSSRAQSRDVERTAFSKNNLDCLRLILASAVFVFHVYALTELRAFEIFGQVVSPVFAVRAFFVVSGLLIYRSYLQSKSVKSYFEKRIRRIYPAYFTAIVVAALACLPLSTMHAAQYFGLGFWKYLAANLVFLNFLAPSLPGVFATNSISAVNGALWTLKIEAAFYLFIPVLHALCKRWGTKRVMSITFLLSCLWKYGFAFLATVGGTHGFLTLDSSRNIFAQLEVQFPAQLAYFIAGILLMLNLEKLKTHFFAIACISTSLYLVDHWLTGGIFDVFWISGLVVVVGFARYLGNFSKFGDFSYGVYIVHWPILQTMIALKIGSRNPAAFLAVNALCVLVTAFLMWHLVEKRFLNRSSHYRQEDPKTSSWLRGIRSLRHGGLASRRTATTLNLTSSVRERT